MPILDLQRRITERGRIRLGRKVPTQSGKQRPAKSETFIISAKDRPTVVVAARTYGVDDGTIEQFDGGYRVDTNLTELPVILPPGDMSFSQWYELWGNKVCYRRCDGQRETISDGPCQCDDDPRVRECKTTTRMSVMLPDMPGLGLWRLESHGYYAATELAGAVEAISFLAPRTLVRARLLAVPREVTRIGKDGKVTTNKFVVPTIDLPDVRLAELVASDGGVGVAIRPPAATGALTPVPVAELPEAPRLSVADQIAQVPARPKRSNAAAELPPSGLDPTTTVDPWKSLDPDGWDRWRKRCMAKSSKVLDAEPDRTEQRHGLAAQATAKLRGTPVESWNDVTETEAKAIEDALDRLKDGSALLTFDQSGNWVCQLSSVGRDTVPPVAGDGVPAGNLSPGGGDGPGVETPAGDSPGPVTPPMLLAATGKPTVGAQKLAVSRAAKACGSELMEADDICADPVLAETVLARLEAS